MVSLTFLTCLGFAFLALASGILSDICHHHTFQKEANRLSCLCLALFWWLQSSIV